MVELRRSTRVAATNKRVSKEEEVMAPPAKKSKAKKAVSNGMKEETDPQTKNLAEGKNVQAKTKKEHDESDSKEEAPVSNDNDNDEELEVGDEIPDIKLQNQDGDEISLKEVANDNRIIIIFAYPKASTPGCTRQACGFRDNYEDLKEHAAVFGLSNDSPKPQKSFQTKQKLPFDLLCDPKRVLIGRLGAKKTPQSGTIRSHWIFVDGKLKSKNVKVSPEVSVEQGKKEVLELAKGLE